jgi:hypothetical protein
MPADYVPRTSQCHGPTRSHRNSHLELSQLNCMTTDGRAYFCHYIETKLGWRRKLAVSR